MTITIEERNKSIQTLVNGTTSAIRTVVPLDHEIAKSQRFNQSLQIQFGVLVGITGEIKGKLVFAGDAALFGSIGQVMFGMPLEGEMLASFSGELGNMLAGSVATHIHAEGFTTDITSPTIIQGNTTLSGFEKAHHVSVTFGEMGEMDSYLLLD